MMNKKIGVELTNEPVVTDRLQIVVLTLIDKDTEIIDDYKNYYSVYTFKTENGDFVVYKVKNQKLDLEINKKAAFTFLDGEMVAYKPNKNKKNSAEILELFSHMMSKPNIAVSFISIFALNIPFFNSLVYLVYALTPLFQRSDLSLIDDEVINISKYKKLIPLLVFFTLVGLVGSSLIFYGYPIVGVLLNLAISLPFIYNSNRIECEVIDEKNILISKIKADLDNFKIEP